MNKEPRSVSQTFLGFILSFLFVWPFFRIIRKHPICTNLISLLNVLVSIDGKNVDRHPMLMGFFDIIFIYLFEVGSDS
jgi:hypothetical protein